MEQKTLQLIAKLRRLAGRQGKPFDVLKFSEDSGYAQSTLSQLMDTEDEEILVTGLSLQQAMTSLPTAPSAQEVVVKPDPVSAAPTDVPSGVRSYIGRLR